MSQTLCIEEQREPYWKFVAAVTAILAVVLFVIYWNMSDVFWAGMVRLASFACFAGAILSGLKAVEGGITIEVHITNSTLIFRYLKKGKPVLEGEHELDNIESVSYAGSTSVFSSESNYVIIIKFRDSDKNFNLFHFSGRSIKLSRDDTHRLVQFLDEQGIQTSG